MGYVNMITGDNGVVEQGWFEINTRQDELGEMHDNTVTLAGYEDAPITISGDNVSAELVRTKWQMFDYATGHPIDGEYEYSDLCVASITPGATLMNIPEGTSIQIFKYGDYNINGFAFSLADMYCRPEETCAVFAYVSADGITSIKSYFSDLMCDLPAGMKLTTKAAGWYTINGCCFATTDDSLVLTLAEKEDGGISRIEGLGNGRTIRKVPVGCEVILAFRCLVWVST